MDFTMYCGSGVCAPFGTNHKATATVEYYYVSGGFRSVYSQSVSGTLSPGSSPVACGYYRWLFVSPATYSTAEGTITINGWVRTGALCNSNSTCDGYSSTNDYWLRCNGNCTGNFKTASYFSTRCIPTSIGHTLYLGF
jgi:hypothetical protein